MSNEQELIEAACLARERGMMRMEVCGECKKEIDTGYEGVSCEHCGSTACLDCQAGDDCWNCGNKREKENGQ